MKKENLLFLFKTIWLPILVALVPAFYQKITEPKVDFQYDVSQGPAIQEDSLFKKIIVISFYNTGSKNLNNIVAKIQIPEGHIKTYSYSVTEPLEPNITHKVNILGLNMPSMMPSDSLSLSLLTETSRDYSEINVSVRSEEIIALKKEKGRSVTVLSILSLLFSIGAVFLTFFSSKSSINKRIRNLEKQADSLEEQADKQDEKRKRLEKELGEAKELVDRLEKAVNEMEDDDHIFYLSLLINDRQISQLIAVDKIITYPRMSDIIYQRYTTDTTNDNYKKGQFCLFVLSKDAEGARLIIKNNLKKMGLNEMSSDVEEKLLKTIKLDYVSTRNEFDQIFKLGIDGYIKSKTAT